MQLEIKCLKGYGTVKSLGTTDLGHTEPDLLKFSVNTTLLYYIWFCEWRCRLKVVLSSFFRSIFSNHLAAHIHLKWQQQFLRDRKGLLGLCHTSSYQVTCFQSTLRLFSQC